MEDERIFRDLEIINDSRSTRAKKNYKSRLNALQFYNDVDLKKNYRFDKDNVVFIKDLIEDDIKPASNKGSSIAPLTMVCIALRHLAKGSYQLDTADIHGVSQKTVSTVVNALASKLPQFVNFPESSQDLRVIKRDFFNKFGFPQCLGAIDCTHIKIKNPGGELGARFRCRKGFYSLNVQMLVNSNSEILDIVARWRGSAHDSRICNSSTIKSRLQHMNRMRGVILGYGGYKQTNIMMTPFRFGTTLTSDEQKYQRHHILERGVVERTFGQLKNCLRCFFNGLHCNLNTAKNSVAAIAVLWNIAKKRGVSLSEETNEFAPAQQTNANFNIIEEHNEQRGRQFRSMFIATHFRNTN